MKRICLLAVVVMLTVASGIGYAVTFSPEPSNLWDLDHGYYYAWSIENIFPADKPILGASLTFYGIYNNIVDPDNRLFVHLLPASLLPQPPQNITLAGYDYGEQGDNFAGMGTYVGMWSDPDSYGTLTDLVFQFVDGTPLAPYFDANHRDGYERFVIETPILDTFRSYAQDGYFGFGIDPDCHYYNSGISFDVSMIPEPATMMLLGFGIIGVAGLVRGNKKTSKPLEK